MLSRFTGGGPEGGKSQEIADDISEVRCVGIIPGHSDIYTRDPKKPAKFVYRGQVANNYHPAFDDKIPVPDWAKCYLTEISTKDEPGRN